MLRAKKKKTRKQNPNFQGFNDIVTSSPFLVIQKLSQEGCKVNRQERL